MYWNCVNNIEHVDTELKFLEVYQYK